jgi:signal transduction histidine kinase
MQTAWQIAPAPALWLPAAGAGAPACEPNAAARAWTPTAAWEDADWQRLGDVIRAAGAAVGQADALGIAWQCADLEGGSLAWLSRPPGAPGQSDDDGLLQQLTLAGSLAGISLWRIDLRTGRILLSDPTADAAGRKPTLRSMPLEEARAAIHPEDREGVVRAAEEALRGTGFVDVRARYRTPDGRYRTLLTRRIAQRDPQGDPVALVGVSMDETRQVDERARFDATVARMDLIAEATGIGVWSIDLRSRERHWNGQMRRLFGVPDGAAIPVLRRQLALVVLPEDRGKADELVRRVEQASARVLDPAHTDVGIADSIETEFRTRIGDGPVRWLVARTQVLRQGPQAIAHGVVIDVTEFRATQVELRMAQSRVELAARAAGIGTWEVAADGGVPIWDAQMYALRGLSPDDPRPVDELIRSLPPPDDDPQVEQKVRAAFAAGGGYSNEFRVRWPDGTVRWLASRGVGVAGPDGRMTGMFGINWDITEQKRVEQMEREKLAAEEASRAKSELLARMSHELRTPLNAVIGFAELLSTAPAGRIGDLERGHAGLIRGAGQHLLALIDDVLELARIDAARTALASEPVDLDAVLADVVRWVETEAREAQVSVDADVGGRVVQGDPRSLRQVFANLLSNGIKYNRPGGQVRVAVLPAEAGDRAWTVVRVSDTGRGLSADQLAHLFEPFNRLGAERGEIQGTGIGLAITHQLVQRMGGRIEARSRLGQGSEFLLWLPAHAALPAPPIEAVDRLPEPACAMPDPGPAPTDGEPLAALYVEDNPVNLLLVQELFSRKPRWRLHTAVNGADGVEKARRLRPRLALIDMQLPDMHGTEVLARLRAMPGLQPMRCVALSANAMPDDVNKALAAGFDDYWTKPIDFQGFLGALDQLARPE